MITIEIFENYKLVLTQRKNAAIENYYQVVGALNLIEDLLNMAAIEKAQGEEDGREIYKESNQKTGGSAQGTGNSKGRKNTC